MPKNRGNRIDTGRKDSKERPIYNWINPVDKVSDNNLINENFNDFDNSDPYQELYSKIPFEEHIENKRAVYMKSLDWNNINDETRNKVLDYYASPNGYAQLCRRGVIEQCEGKFYGDACNHNDIKEFKNMVDNHREKLLESLKYKPVLQSEVSVSFDHQLDFIDDNIIREFKGNNDDRKAYSNYAEAFATRFSPEQRIALSWLSSDGAHIMNQYLNSNDDIDEITYGKNHDNDFYKLDNIEDNIDYISDAINDHADNDKIIVYRGLNSDYIEHIINKEVFSATNEDFAQAFPVGSTIELEGFSSASASPSVASRFSSGIIFEMKTNRTIPIGGVSAWGEAEQEMLVDKDIKFKVAHTGVMTYNINEDGSQRERYVVQLEQVDD